MFVRGIQFVVLIVMLTAGSAAQDAPGVSSDMSFFITSTGRGFGGNLAGLDGADAICRMRAAAVGRGGRVWRAYLSALKLCVLATLPTKAPRSAH